MTTTTTLPSRDQLLAVIQAAFEADDLEGVKIGLRLLVLVAPDDAELIITWIEESFRPGPRATVTEQGWTVWTDENGCCRIAWKAEPADHETPPIGFGRPHE